MKTSADGIALMHRFESCRLEAYPDPGSKDGHPWTIGWGSTGPGIAKGVRWTQEQCDERFAADLGKFERGVIGMVKVQPFAQREFDALVAFAYNIGLSALEKSTLLRMLNSGQKSAAADQFLRWDKNDGKRMLGLARRRAAERALFLGRDWKAAAQAVTA